MQSVVIAGASLAGLAAAEALRDGGFDGTLTVVDREAGQPTDRPPLSKDVLAGERQPEEIVLHGASADLGITWERGRRATALDLAGSSVALDDGRSLPFDGLVIATGATPRWLPGTEGMQGVHVLRTVEDCLALRDELDAGPARVVVVGAGFIGAEVAATCRGRGHEVTLLEALPVPLGRVLGDLIGGFCASLHRDNGVDLRVGTGVDGFDTDDAGRVRAVRLADGSSVETDVVVVGIGVVPNTGWLEGSGLTVDNGVVCDETLLAAPGVVAAGDIARWPNGAFDGEVMRIEHWDNAVDQGAHAGTRLLAHGAGEPGEAFAPVPWFWSDQYDVKIQLAGRCRPDDDVAIVQGSLAEKRFVALYGRSGRVVAAIGCNRPAQIVRYRRALEAGPLDWNAAVAGAGSS